MFYSSFVENKGRQGNSYAKMIEEFCKSQCKKYNLTCSKPHTEPHSSVDLDQEAMREAFFSRFPNKPRSDTPIYFFGEYDPESEWYAAEPQEADPSKPIVLQYPFSPSTSKATTSTSVSSKQVKNSKGNEGQTKQDERADSSELDTIIEETEGDEQELGGSKPDPYQILQARIRKASVRERRALILEAYNHYYFDESNPMLDLEDPFRDGVRRMSTGHITIAIFYLEAAVQRQPPYNATKRAIAWMFLGLCQAANDHDILAIAAFRESLKLEPRDHNCLIGLAVSYANEGQRNLAIHAIWRWLCETDYREELENFSLPVDVKKMDAPLDLEIHHKVIQMVLFVAYKCKGGFLDVNVQSALGILHSLIGDFENGIKHYHTATLLAPKDERLWSHFGACLASNRQHSEAIKAFSNAIALSPRYVKVHYNWAISYSKTGLKEEAIQRLILALMIQARPARGLTGRTSERIWSKLKELVTAQEKTHLDDAIRRRDVGLLGRIFGIE